MSKTRGARSISRLLKRLPEEVAQEVIVELNVSGRDIAAAMRGRTPYRTGALQSGISYKVLPKSLKLQVGILGGPTARGKIFYGRILDLGRKAQVVQAKRRSADGSVSTYAMNVGPIPAKHFVTGKFTELRTALGNNLRNIWQRSIARAASGGTGE